MEKINEENLLNAKVRCYAKTNTTKWLGACHKLADYYGDTEFALVLGDYLYREKRFDDAIQYYKKVLDDKDRVINALYGLCQCYLVTNDDQSFFGALSELKKEKSSLYHLCAINYWCKKKDENQAIKIADEACLINDINSNKAILLLANYLDENKDYKNAHKYYSILAKRYVNYACNKLGDYYLNGFGVSKDINKAFHYYLYANNKDSFTTIGGMFLMGDVVAQDDELAIYNFLNAVRLGDNISYIGLASIYGNTKSKYYSKKRYNACLESFFKNTKWNEKIYNQVIDFIDSNDDEELRKDFNKYIDKYWNRKDIQA